MSGVKPRETEMKGNQIAVCVLVAVVAVLATLLVTGEGRARFIPAAYGQDSVAGGYVVALIGNETSGRYPVVVVDSKEMTLMVYEYNRANFSFDLKGVRSFRHDRQLRDFKGKRSGGPSVEDVMQRLERGNR